MMDVCLHKNIVWSILRLKNLLSCKVKGEIRILRIWFFIASCDLVLNYIKIVFKNIHNKVKVINLSQHGNRIETTWNIKQYNSPYFHFEFHVGS